MSGFSVRVLDDSELRVARWTSRSRPCSPTGTLASSELDEDPWLRIVDVPAALAARGYGAADPIVVEIRDRLLPANSGRYRISPQGMERSTNPAAVRRADLRHRGQRLVRDSVLISGRRRSRRRGGRRGR
jgi:hypothetical protein